LRCQGPAATRCRGPSNMLSRTLPCCSQTITFSVLPRGACVCSPLDLPATMRICVTSTEPEVPGGRAPKALDRQRQGDATSADEVPRRFDLGRLARPNGQTASAERSYRDAGAAAGSRAKRPSSLCVGLSRLGAAALGETSVHGPPARSCAPNRGRSAPWRRPTCRTSRLIAACASKRMPGAAFH
jgi:hypothetical protein